MGKKNSDTSNDQALAKVTDLLGLPDLAKQLVENISRGLGKLTTAHLLKKQASAAAKATRDISQEMKRAGLLPVAGEVNIEERARVRLHYQEVQRQSNLESVSTAAIEELRDAGDMLPPHTSTAGMQTQEVSADWLARFMLHAQHVTAEEMQRVWGRVLAHETTKPGTFSFRALDTLSTMSQQDALAFQRVCYLTYHLPEKSGVLLHHGYGTIPAQPLIEPLKKVLNLDDLSLMQTFGLFYPDSFLGQLLIPTEDGTTRLRISGMDLVVSHRERKEFDLGPQYRMTPLGMELMRLIDEQPNLEYVDIIRQSLEGQGYSVRTDS